MTGLENKPAAQLYIREAPNGATAHVEGVTSRGAPSTRCARSKSSPSKRNPGREGLLLAHSPTPSAAGDRGHVVDHHGHLVRDDRRRPKQNVDPGAQPCTPGIIPDRLRWRAPISQHEESPDTRIPPRIESTNSASKPSPFKNKTWQSRCGWRARSQLAPNTKPQTPDDDCAGARLHWDIYPSIASTERRFGSAAPIKLAHR